MMFLIALLLILLLLWCYLFVTSSILTSLGAVWLRSQPSWAHMMKEFGVWVFFLVFGFLLKNKKKKKLIKKRIGLRPSNLHILDSHPSCQPRRRQPVNPASLINYRLIQQSTLQSWAILRKAKWATIVSVEILVKWPKCLQPQFPHPLKVISLLQGLLWAFKAWHTEDTLHPSPSSPQLLKRAPT